MSVTIITDETKTLYVTESNQNWVVDIGASIKVANGHGMVNYGGYTESTMVTAGDIVADGLYKSGMYSEGDWAKLQVDTTGSIHGYNGMAFYGQGTYAENRGTITAANIGIYGNADTMKIANYGTIDAKYGMYVENADTLSSGLNNYGTITGDYGIFSTKGAKVINYSQGVIDSHLTAVTLGDNALTANTLVNSGLIESDDIAVLGSSGSDVVTNWGGTIKGRILLGAGDDTFINAAGGTVDHVVDGGLGDDTYGFDNGSFVIVDAGGNDTITSTIGRSLAGYASIETLMLTGTTNINGTGNALVNTIFGNDGDNTLNGGIDSLTDVLVGGGGNDTYVLGAGDDTVYEFEKTNDPDSVHVGGIDTITSTISRTLADYDEVENLKLIGSGNLNGTGNYLANVISGTLGNNILDGGIEDHPQGDQIDTLIGGAGNDTYVLAAGHDKVVDTSGIDTITSTITRSLADYATIENLTLLGTGNLSGTGNALANVITGNDQNNVLDGGVDTVVDKLIGGAGNDIYILGSGSDIVVDTAGFDSITSTSSRNLENYASIENLFLQGSGNVNAFGNALVNIIGGNAGNNLLYGGDDDVIDTLSGDLGNDTYVLGAGFDLVIDGGGKDTITSTITRSLAGYAGIENLTLLGTGNTDGTGNALANVITGNAGNNVLDGGYDSVVDTLKGGAGNDTYVLGAGHDIVIDTSGYNTITSTISRNLADYADIQVLTLVGTGNVSATGNDKNNVLTGNEGANAMSGGAGQDVLKGANGDDILNGGVDDDVLWGGNGADTFVYKSGYGKDTVGDFADGIDHLKVYGTTWAGVELTDVADGVIITFDTLGGSLFLKGIDAAHISAGDFVFV